MYNNNIGPQGAILLAKSLITSKLKSLRVENNFIGPTGALALLNIFKNNKCTLKYLYVKFNFIGPLAIHLLMQFSEKTSLGSFIQF
jgi:hypothetical protein